MWFLIPGGRSCSAESLAGSSGGFSTFSCASSAGTSWPSDGTSWDSAGSATSPEPCSFALVFESFLGSAGSPSFKTALSKSTLFLPQACETAPPNAHLHLP
ncbi:hypothetical protein AAHE18_01G045900 [Arachis hypogaea]